MKHVDIKKCSASEFISYYRSTVCEKDINAIDVVRMHKAAGFFMSLVAPTAKFLAKTILPFAAISGVLGGVTAEGSVKDKALAGAEEMSKQLISPKKLFTNIVGFGLPSWGVGKLMGKSNAIVKGIGTTAAGFAGGSLTDNLTGNEVVEEGADDPFLS